LICAYSSSLYGHEQTGFSRRSSGKQIATGLYSVSARKNSQNEIRTGLPDVLPAVWRFAFSMSGRADVADDLVQATCVRAIEKAEQFRRGSNLRAWCFTICRSIWLNEVRAQAVRKTGGLDTPEINDIADLAPTQEANIFALQVVHQVMCLPEAIRATVLLVYVEQFTYKEAAEMLDIPIGTVMSRLASARAKLAPLNQTESLASQSGTQK
jgi:RNA polymerase sigma-70 factor (ECF subfamily)